MFMEVVALSLLVALARGGRPREFIKLRHPWLPVLAFTIQWVARRWLPPHLYLSVFIVTYAMLVAFGVCNVRYRGIVIFLGGLILNIVVMAANGGYMPVDLDKARSMDLRVDYIQAGESFKHRPLLPDSRLGWLGDVIPVPVPRPRMVSAGDVVAAVGVFLLMQEWMRPRKLSPGQRRELAH